MPTDLKQLSTYITESEKIEFAAQAEASGYSSSMLLAHIVRLFLSRQTPVKEDKLPEDRGLKDGHVTVNFRRATYESLRKRAAEKGMKPASYLAALYMAHSREEPYFSSSEITALRDAARELSALGRNVNQIAKAINITREEIYQVKGLELAELHDAVSDVRVYLKSLLAANLESWGVKQNGG
ncbi:hypothetical protein ACI29J_003133 [Escherichia coli]